MNTEFNYKWIVWYHYDKDNWNASGFKQLYKINNIADLWKLYNNFQLIGGVTNKHLFIMKEGVLPVWEDPNNINGGCWSFKILEDHSAELWEDLSVALVCNKITSNDDIMGLSICLKKNSNVVVKIWNKSSNNSSLKLLNNSILEKWGTDIIYIAHMSK